MKDRGYSRSDACAIRTANDAVQCFGTVFSFAARPQNFFAIRSVIQGCRLYDVKVESAIFGRHLLESKAYVAVSQSQMTLRCMLWRG